MSLPDVSGDQSIGGATSACAGSSPTNRWIAMGYRMGAATAAFLSGLPRTASGNYRDASVSGLREAGGLRGALYRPRRAYPGVSLRQSL